MRQTHSIFGQKTWLSVLIVLLLLLCLWFALFTNKMPVTELPAPTAGVTDLRQVELSAQVAELSTKWDYYPWQLYTPEDFAAGSTIAPQLRSEVHEAWTIPYGTHRLVLRAQPKQYYTICGYSIDYGTRVFVGGNEVLEVGEVADNAADAVGRVNYMSFPVYTGEDGVVELVFQYANFVHNEGGSQNALLISTPQNINRYQIEQNLPVYLISGGLLILAAYYLLDACLRRKKEALALAFCCLLFALRDQRFYIVQLIPWDYNWHLHYRIVVAVIALTPMAILLLLESFFPKQANKWVTRVYAAATGLCTAALFAFPTQKVAAISDLCNKFALPYFVYLAFCIGRYFYRTRRVSRKHMLTLCGIGILVVASLIEIKFNRIIPAVTRGGVMPIGMLLFVMLSMTVVALQANEDEAALQESRQKEALLASMNTMKSDFLRKMAHELKTPLTVISGYAQLTGWQIEGGQINEETVKNLKTISEEAMRLSHLVSKLVDISYGEPSAVEKSAVSVRQLFSDVTALCRPMLEKNQNTITEDCENCPEVYANHEMLLQVLINLIINANKHTSSGTVALSACENENNAAQVCIRVADTGSGIPPESLAHIFEQGYSTDGGNGLGLSICQEAAQLHGGSLLVEQTGDQGTTMLLILPKLEKKV